MSKNILQLLVDSIWDCGVSGCKMISKAFHLDWNEYEFKKFFEAVSLRNNKGIYPKLKKKTIEGVYKIYIFDVPIGLSLSDFNSKISQLSFFMKINEEDLLFEAMEGLEGVRLKVLSFNDFFRLYQVKNERNKYPVLKNQNEEYLYDSYVFEIPSGINIEQFKFKFEKLPTYLKLKEGVMKYEIVDIEDSYDIEVRIYK